MGTSGTKTGRGLVESVRMMRAGERQTIPELWEEMAKAPSLYPGLLTGSKTLIQTGGTKKDLTFG